MILNNFKTLALASMVGFSSFSAYAQADDMPAKGQIQKMSTIEVAKLFSPVAVYGVSASEMFEKWNIKGWALNADASAITSGVYSSNAKYSLTSKSIKLPKTSETESLNLNITEAFSLESDYDFGTIELSDDGGQSWKSIVRISGQSEERINSLNISRYAGKSVIIRLLLSADGSFESTGWDVKAINIYKGSLIPVATKKVRSSLKAGGVIEKKINITSIHDANFPDAVFIDFEYTEDGAFGTGMDDDLLEVTENGILQSDRSCYKLWKGTETYLPLDIVFLVDNSGSMQDVQAKVISTISHLVNNLAGKRVCRFAYVRFGARASNGYPVQVQNTHGIKFESNPVVFSQLMTSTSTIDGGFEPYYDALMSGLSLPFHQLAEKVFVIVTDENTYESTNSNLGNFSQAQAIAAMKAQDVRVFSVIPNESQYDNTYGKVSLQTDGARYDITTDFSGDLQNKLTQTVLQKYTLRYCPLNTVKDGLARTVNLSLINESTVLDTDTYTPLIDEITIIRMKNASQYDTAIVPQANIPIPIGVIVNDWYAPYPTSVTLYYRTLTLTSTSTFLQLAMVGDPNTSYPNKKFLAFIPASAVVNPGFEWYAIAKYADGTEVITPTSTKDFFAWTVGVFPNYPPAIAQTSRTPIVQNQEMTVNFTVSDITMKVEDVVFYYREYMSPAMFMPHIFTPEVNGINYSMKIPATAMSGQGIEYYIRAKDNYGVNGFYGTASSPIVVKVLDGITIIDQVTVTTDSMMLSFNQPTFECDILKVGDVLRVYYATNNGKTLVAAGATTVTTAGQYSIPEIKVYGSVSATAKNGFDENETIRFLIERGGVKTELKPSVPVTYQKKQSKQAQGLSGSDMPRLKVSNLNKTIEIASGDLTPDTSDGTNFGEQGSVKSITYVMQNTGCKTLTFTKPTLSSNANFTVSPPSSLSLAPYGETHLTITYNPTADADAVVHIANNGKDADYTFGIEGDKLVQTVSLNASVSPNPMNPWGGELNYTIPSSQTVKIDLYSGANFIKNVKNAMVYTGSSPMIASDWIDMGAYPAGGYILVITTSTGLSQSVTFSK